MRYYSQALPSQRRYAPYTAVTDRYELRTCPRTQNGDQIAILTRNPLVDSINAPPRPTYRPLSEYFSKKLQPVCFRSVLHGHCIAFTHSQIQTHNHNPLVERLRHYQCATTFHVSEYFSGKLHHICFRSVLHCKRRNTHCTVSLVC